MKTIGVIVRKTWKEIFVRKETKWLILFFNLLLFATTLINYDSVAHHNRHVNGLGKEVKEKWDNNPDKHPHRMSHYGYLVFRAKYPLSFFDKGLDNYLGNSAFLEAHKQNTVNFSEQSFSNNILAFGEISAGMILQLLLTLLIFFWGYNVVSKERENGMLRLMLIQGMSWRKILLGKSLGLFLLSLTICVPVFILVLPLLFSSDIHANSETFIRYGLLFIAYIVYFLTLSLFTVLVSAVVKSSKLSLTVLVGYWLFFVVLFPKISVIMGQTIYPSPSKVEFDIEVENEMQKHGDSHNPNDPYFTHLRDSLLHQYQVEKVEDLPFNYSGFIMKESEKLSSRVYNERKKALEQTFIKQQDFVKWTAMINPYFAIKNISSSLSGTDYLEYLHFEKQAEKFRYFLAQYLNDLQMKHISNAIKSSADKRAALSQIHWKNMNDFTYQYRNVNSLIQSDLFSLMALFVWLIGIYVVIILREKHFSAI